MSLASLVALSWSFEGSASLNWNIRKNELLYGDLLGEFLGRE